NLLNPSCPAPDCLDPAYRRYSQRISIHPPPGWVIQESAFDYAPTERTKSPLFFAPCFSALCSEQRSPGLLVSSPCNSTALLNSSRTCNNPHHGVAPDRNQVTIVGVDLPAFLLSKNFSFRVHRNASAVAETCLVGLTRSAFFSSGFVSTNPEPQAISPSSSAFLVPFSTQGL